MNDIDCLVLLRRLRVTAGTGASRSACLRDGLVRLIRAGALQAGDRLPPVRDLATGSGVNRNTAQRVYTELVAAGLLRSRVGDGTYVNAVDRGDGARLKREMRGRLRTVLEDALDAGFASDDVEAMLQVELDDLRAARSGSAAEVIASRNRFAMWGRYSEAK